MRIKLRELFEGLENRLRYIDSIAYVEKYSILKYEIIYHLKKESEAQTNKGSLVYSLLRARGTLSVLKTTFGVLDLKCTKNDFWCTDFTCILCMCTKNDF